jgi:hypothetical protein
MTTNSRTIRSIALLSLLMLGGSVLAAPTQLANSPISGASSVEIAPNILFVLDDSGSMDWDYLPDWAGLAAGLHQSKNAGFNGLAYNPAVTYLAPKYFDASGAPDTTTYPSQELRRHHCVDVGQGRRLRHPERRPQQPDRQRLLLHHGCRRVLHQPEHEDLRRRDCPKRHLPGRRPLALVPHGRRCRRRDARQRRLPGDADRPQPGATGDADQHPVQLPADAGATRQRPDHQRQQHDLGQQHHRRRPADPLGGNADDQQPGGTRRLHRRAPSTPAASPWCRRARSSATAPSPSATP